MIVAISVYKTIGTFRRLIENPRRYLFTLSKVVNIDLLFSLSRPSETLKLQPWTNVLWRNLLFIQKSTKKNYNNRNMINTGLWNFKTKCDNGHVLNDTKTVINKFINCNVLLKLFRILQSILALNTAQ